MNVREARDFLVQQTAEQAVIDGVGLSDLERRMMYYAQGDSAREIDADLNDEFHTQYDSQEYQTKISRLLHGRYTRLKTSNPELARRWDDCVRFLAKGDHYISVLWESSTPKERQERQPGDAWKLLASSILVVAALFAWLLEWTLWYPGSNGCQPCFTPCGSCFWVQVLFSWPR